MSLCHEDSVPLYPNLMAIGTRIIYHLSGGGGLIHLILDVAPTGNGQRGKRRTQTKGGHLTNPCIGGRSVSCSYSWDTWGFCSLYSFTLPLMWNMASSLAHIKLIVQKLTRFRETLYTHVKRETMCTLYPHCTLHEVSMSVVQHAF